MTGIDHQENASIAEAAQWLSRQTPPPSPILPELRRRFPLTPVEACQAIREAHLIRARAH